MCITKLTANKIGMIIITKLMRLEGEIKSNGRKKFLQKIIIMISLAFNKKKLRLCCV